MSSPHTQTQNTLNEDSGDGSVPIPSKAR